MFLSLLTVYNYTTITNPLFPYISYTHLSPSHKAYIVSLNSEIEPNSYTAASLDPRWVKAMQLEIDALNASGTWQFVDLPANTAPNGNKWVNKIKRHANGTVERFKVRLFWLIPEFAKMSTIIILVVLASIHGWHIHQLYANFCMENCIKLSIWSHHKKWHLLNLGKFVSCLSHCVFFLIEYGLTRGQANHTFMTWWLLLRVLRYLKRSPRCGTFFPRTFDLGDCFFIGHSLVSWKSKKQQTISCSSTATEYRALTSATRELQWISFLLRDLLQHPSRLSVLYCDNQCVLQITTNVVFP